MKKCITAAHIAAMVIFSIAGFMNYAFAGNENNTPEAQTDSPAQHSYQKSEQYLSDEDRNKLKEKKIAFMEATKDLRQSIREKKMELRSELTKKEPDAQKARQIQKEINTLQGELNLKQIDQIIREKKINPYAAGPGMMKQRKNGPAESRMGKHGPPSDPPADSQK